MLLREQDFSKWLNGKDIFESIVTKDISYYPVSTKVNNPKNNNSDNLKTI